MNDFDITDPFFALLLFKPEQLHSSQTHFPVEFAQFITTRKWANLLFSPLPESLPLEHPAWHKHCITLPVLTQQMTQAQSVKVNVTPASGTPTVN